MIVSVVNPLPRALNHYQRELTEALENAGVQVDVERSAPIESLSASGKLRSLLRLLGHRMNPEKTRGIRLVIWPALGYWDPLLWMRGRSRTFTVIHDPTPLRRQFGYSRTARWLLGRSSASNRIICHSDLAETELVETLGQAPLRVVHPMIAPACRDTNLTDEPVLRVLGQYKDTRSLDALHHVSQWAKLSPGRAFRLEIIGRGWPPVDGWAVRDEFVSEEEFSHLLTSSDAVVLPYTRVYQSGVAVRCFEAGVPIISPEHEQISELYGEDWPGTVRNGEWGQAVEGALVAEVVDRQRIALAQHDAEWARLVAVLTNIAAVSEGVHHADD